MHQNMNGESPILWNDTSLSEPLDPHISTCSGLFYKGPHQKAINKSTGSLRVVQKPFEDPVEYHGRGLAHTCFYCNSVRPRFNRQFQLDVGDIQNSPKSDTLGQASAGIRTEHYLDFPA
jgi:hypothetical protein